MATSIPTITLYVLRLKENKYYVGKTSQDIHARYAQHARGEGAEWTKRYPPVMLVEQRSFLEDGLARLEETKRTCEMMLLHGVNNVRGGELTDSRDYCRGDLFRLCSTLGHHLDKVYEDVRKRISDELPPSPASKPPAAIATPIQPTASSASSAVHRSAWSSTSSSTSARASRRLFPSSAPYSPPNHAPGESASQRNTFSVCARCGSRKETADPDKPLCRSCWEATKYALQCAACGAFNERDVPLCYDCWTRWSDNRGTRMIGRVPKRRRRDSSDKDNDDGDDEEDAKEDEDDEAKDSEDHSEESDDDGAPRSMIQRIMEITRTVISEIVGTGGKYREEHDR